MMTKAELEEEYEKRMIEYRKILPYLTQEVQDCYRVLKENNSIRIDQDCFFTIKGTGSFVSALTICVVPFVIPDTIKIILAFLASKKLMYSSGKDTKKIKNGFPN